MNISKLLSLISGVSRTVDFANNSNTFEIGGGGIQFDGSTSGHVVVSASATTATYSIVWPAAQAASTGYVLTNDGTGVLSWSPAAATGVTSVSVVSANGLAGTVATATTTPAITLSTTITGILQGNGTAISAASTTGSGAVVLATSPTLVTPALGTPSALVGTNITGTAAGLTAGTVTTNANLTGDVTSVGNATTLIATTNSTITTLSALSLPGAQVTGNISGNAANVTGIVALVNGGTGVAAGSANAAFNALSPMTTLGDTIYGGAAGIGTRLAIGSTGQVLTVVGGIPAWAAPAVSPSSITLTQNHILVGNASNLAADVAMSGDAGIAASGALTLSTVNTNVGSFGSSTSIPSFTVNGKGLITAASGNAVIAPAGTLTGTTLASNVVTSSLTSLGTQAQALNMGGNQINGVTNPTSAQDAATKDYVDSAINGLEWKGPVQAYSNANVPLTGGATLTIDGYAVQNGDFVILANQTVPAQQGIYLASGIGTAYVLTAATGAEAPTAIGDAYLVEKGTSFGNSAFQVNAISPNITFIQFAGPNSYSFTAPLSLTGNTVSISQSTTSTDGYLSSADWNTFNNKQPAGNYITALTGDATAAGPGSAALTFATVNTNTGSFGSSTSIPTFTVNGKGLITAASGNAVVAPAGTLTGTTLNATVVTSSLTSVGTITTGVWNGTAVDPTHGGTGQTSYAVGDTLYASAINTLSKLTIGSTGNVLTVSGGVPVWAAPAASGTVTSVAFADGSTTPIYTVTGSPVTSSGTLTVTLASQSANTVFAGPNGSSGQPGFRALVSADLAAGIVGTTQIAAAAVTAAKLGAVTDGITTDQSGAGSTIEVLSSPAIKSSEIAGESFAATTLWAVRYALAADSGFVAGRVYKADYDTTSADKFYVVGLARPAGSVSAAGAITMTSDGIINVPSHGFTVGTPVYLSASGAVTNTAPSTALQAIVKVGMVKDANNILVQIQVMGVN